MTETKQIPFISTTSRYLLSLSCLLMLAVMLCGCAEPEVKVVSSPTLTTLNIDAKDYNDIASKLDDAISNRREVVITNAVSLGPVAVALDGPYRFDPVTLQEKIQASALERRGLKFNFAVQAISSNPAATERFKIMELQWTKESTVDPETLREIGRLAHIDYILFGRVSSHTQTQGRKTEVTFTYNWKLGECETGDLVWNHDTELVKSVKQ